MQLLTNKELLINQTNDFQAFGILRGRIDLQHEVSQEENHKHRALAIINPTTDLTGEYTCWVSTFDTEDYRRKTVTIYCK